MALTNFTTIKLLVETYLDRIGFTEITDNTEDFLLLAHKRIIRTVRAPWMETDVVPSVSTSTGEATLPTDYLDSKTLIFTDASETETSGLQRSPRYIVEAEQQKTAPCKFYDTNSSKLYVGPKPAASDTFILQYYKEPVALSSSNATNEISDEAPELYLYGALIEAAVFMKDAETTAMYKAEFEDAKSRVSQYSVVAENSGNAMNGRGTPYLQKHITVEAQLDLVRQALQQGGNL